MHTHIRSSGNCPVTTQARQYFGPSTTFLQYNKGFLHTELWLCHVPSVSYYGKLLHGGIGKYSTELFQRNNTEPLVQICGGQLVQNQNLRGTSFHGTPQLNRQSHQVNKGEYEKENAAFLGLCDTPWERLRVQYWSLLETYSHRPGPGLQLSPPLGTQGGRYQKPTSLGWKCSPKDRGGE